VAVKSKKRMQVRIRQEYVPAFKDDHLIKFTGICRAHPNFVSSRIDHQVPCDSFVVYQLLNIGKIGNFLVLTLFNPNDILGCGWCFKSAFIDIIAVQFTQS
jgi:hypothetical protein